MTPQRTIINLVRYQLEIAEERYRQATADYAGAVAAHKEWDKSNPDDGVGCMSSNPYNPRRAEEYMKNRQLEYQQLREAYDYAVDTFLENDTNERSSDQSDS